MKHSFQCVSPKSVAISGLYRSGYLPLSSIITCKSKRETKKLSTRKGEKRERMCNRSVELGMDAKRTVGWMWRTSAVECIGLLNIVVVCIDSFFHDRPTYLPLIRKWVRLLLMLCQCFPSRDTDFLWRPQYVKLSWVNLPWHASEFSHS